MARRGSSHVSTVRLASGLHFARYAADQGLGLAMSREAFECAELACATRLVGSGDVAIDGGAHLGVYTLHLAQRVGASGRVFAFEPHPQTRALLAEAVTLNAFLDRVAVCSTALGDTSRKGALVTPRHYSGHAHACLGRADARISCSELAIPIEMVALDDLEIAPRVALIKLDVEGAELLAVRGALRLIRRDRPALLCELGDEQLARVSDATSEDVMRELANVGYQAHEIRPDGSAGLRLDAPPTARVSTVLFLPDH